MPSEPLEPILSVPPQPQVRQATSKLSPLRNATRAFQAMQQDEQRLTTRSRTAAGTARERSVHLKQEAPGETRTFLLALARPTPPNR